MIRYFMLERMRDSPAGRGERSHRVDEDSRHVADLLDKFAMGLAVLQDRSNTLSEDEKAALRQQMDRDAQMADHILSFYGLRSPLG